MEETGAVPLISTLAVAVGVVQVLLEQIVQGQLLVLAVLVLLVQFQALL